MTTHVGTARATAAPTCPYSVQSDSHRRPAEPIVPVRYTSRAHTDSRSTPLLPNARPRIPRTMLLRSPSAYRWARLHPQSLLPIQGAHWLTASRNTRIVSQNSRQPRQHRDVAHDVRRVNALLACTKTQSLIIRSDRSRRTPTAPRLCSINRTRKLCRRLLRKVCLLHLQPQRRDADSMV